MLRVLLLLRALFFLAARAENRAHTHTHTETLPSTPTPTPTQQQQQHPQTQHPTQRNSQLRVLVENPEMWATILGVAFPQSSNYFLNYVIARAFMMNLFRLIMPHGGMWRWIGQMLATGCTSARLHAASERYRAAIIYPASIRYGREPGLVLVSFEERERDREGRGGACVCLGIAVSPVSSFFPLHTSLTQTHSPLRLLHAQKKNPPKKNHQQPTASSSS